MFCVSIADAAVQSCGCKVMGVCHGVNPQTWWWKPAVKGAVKMEKAFRAWQACGILGAADRYRQAKLSVALAVVGAKTQVWEAFGEARENDFRSASKTFRQADRLLWRGMQGFSHTVYSRNRALLTSTVDIVGQLKEYFKDLWDPTGKPSLEVKEVENLEEDSSITMAELAEILQW